MYLIFHWCAQITIITSSKWILLCQENINLTYFEKCNQFFFSFRTISRYAIYRGTIFFKDIGFCCISSYSYHNFPMVLMFGNFHVTLCKMHENMFLLKLNIVITCFVLLPPPVWIWWYEWGNIILQNNCNGRMMKTISKNLKNCIYGIKYITNSDWWLVIHLNAKQLVWVGMFGVSDSFEWKAGNLNRNE